MHAEMKRELKKLNIKVEESSILTKRGKGEKILFGIVCAVFIVYSVSLIVPFVYLFINSFKNNLEYIGDITESTALAMPDVWRWHNYVEALSNMKVENIYGDSIYMPEMLFNSIWYSVIGVLSGVTASALTAYILAKYRFKFRGFFYGIAIFSMTIPVIGNTAAMFKLIYSFNIYDSPVFVFVTSFGGFGFNFLILYGFFTNLSWSYAEAVFIDGGGHATVFFKIMLPQALPSVLTLCIMSFITAWNDYMTPLLYLPSYPTLASGIYEIQLSITRPDSSGYPVYFAGLILSMIPVVAIFIGFSDTIMANFTVGGLKG